MSWALCTMSRSLNIMSIMCPLLVYTILRILVYFIISKPPRKHVARTVYSSSLSNSHQFLPGSKAILYLLASFTVWCGHMSEFLWMEPEWKWEESCRPQNKMLRNHPCSPWSAQYNLKSHVIYKDEGIFISPPDSGLKSWSQIILITRIRNTVWMPECKMCSIKLEFYFMTCITNIFYLNLKSNNLR